MMTARTDRRSDLTAFFSESWYLAAYADVANSRQPALKHFRRFGQAEGRNPVPIFDHRWYLQRNSDVMATGQKPFDHFIRYGLAEGRDACPVFDALWYVGAYPDVAASSMPAFEHFLHFGLAEGRDPHPLFDTAFYVERYRPDSDLPPFSAFLLRGLAAGQVPTPLFDPDWYLQRNPDVLATGQKPFDHFIRYGLAEGRDACPVFDALWYVGAYPDVAASSMPAFEHFLHFGLAEGRDPHPLFDTAFYVERYRPDSDLPPFSAFLLRGLAAGQVPTPLFDPDWYLQHSPDVLAAGQVPFNHFIRYGIAEGRPQHILFDAAFYLAAYPDVAASKMPAFEHFFRSGMTEGRDPHPLFCSSWYSELYSDRLQGKPAFLHYLANGLLQPNELFDPAYVAKQLREIENRDEPIRQLSSHGRLGNAARVEAATIAFTSIANNYLPYASVLAESLKRFNPGLHFAIVLCDEPIAMSEPWPFGIDEVVLARDIIGEDFRGWAFQHELVELCTAVKGFAVEYFLERSSCKKVIYLDPDILVTHALDAVDAALEAHSIVVTPHLLAPERDVNAIRQNEIDALRHGAFNLGFLAVRNDLAGRRFAAWWKERLRVFCYDRRVDGLFVDQKWMDLAPSFFPELGILRHPGCNVAPWNLGQRRIVGDSYNGFTVDGEPLVFFHFSGHASGAGEGMLAQYGRDMPAAWLLAALYRHKLALTSADLPDSVPWCYAMYENGVEIAAEERDLYRSRWDLQTRFPDPFRTGFNGSYLHWFRMAGDRNANVAHAMIATAHPGRTLLERFLIVARTDAIRPNPLLDLAFYVDMNMDVARSGCNPFQHFLRTGLNEGRQPSAEFDLRFYGLQSDRTDYSACFQQVLVNGVDEALRPVPTYIARFDRPILDRIAASINDGLPRLLMVSHDWGGGTGKHVKELAALVWSKVNVLSLTYARGNRVTLQVVGENIDVLNFQLGGRDDELIDVLRRLRINRVHVHHAVGLSRSLPKLLRRIGVPYDVTLHDSYFLVPNPLFRHTTASRVRPGLDRAMTEAMATPLGQSLPLGMNLAAWRRHMAPVLRGAERLIAPSRFIADLHLAFYPDIRPIIVPHYEIERPNLPLEPPVLAADAIMTVAVIGFPVAHKGGDTLARVAIASHRRALSVRFLVIGSGSDDLLDAGVNSTGAYDDRDLPALLAKHDVHVLWLPYTAPESYSYVLTVALWCGRQVLSTDVGCFPERAADVPQATILPTETTVEAWLDMLLALRSNLITGKAKAEPVRPQRSVFYPDGYLRVFELEEAHPGNSSEAFHAEARE